MAETQRPAPYPTSAAPGSGVNTAGRVALVAGIVAAVVGLVQLAVGSFVPHLMVQTGASTDQVAAFYSVSTIVHTLIAAVALVFGTIGVRRPGLPHAAAGAGLGIGAVGVAAGIFGLVIVPLISLTL
jgi:hypothetical protein